MTATLAAVLPDPDRPGINKNRRGIERRQLLEDGLTTLWKSWPRLFAEVALNDPGRLPALGIARALYDDALGAYTPYRRPRPGRTSAYLPTADYHRIREPLDEALTLVSALVDASSEGTR